MDMQTLQLQIDLLEQENKKLKSKNLLLNELAVYYADPLVKWDKGERARKLIKSLCKGYKPVNGDLAIMFKEKEVYPFIEFGSYIDDRLENDE